MRHGKSKHPLHSVWRGMKDRCGNRRNKSYADYGGRNIRVCPSWLHDFMSFYTWATKYGWKSGLELHRKNNNGGYTPANCVFIHPSKHSTIETRHSNIISFNGNKLSLSNHARLAGLYPGLVSNRIHKLGWSPNEALTKKARSINNRKYSFNGKSKNMTDWAIEFGLKQGTLSKRLREGWPIKQALTTPIRKTKA